MIVLRIIFYIAIFCITLIYFLPKNELLMFVDNTVLSQYQVNTKIKLENKFLNYVSQNSKIEYQKNSIATFQNIDISPYLLYNKIVCNKIELQGIAGSVFPSKIEYMDLQYSVINPTQVIINGVGEFGKVTGYFDITKLLLHLEVTPSTLLTNNYSFVLNNMKKENKIYLYEYQL